jgi:hypothetical protein
MRADREVLITNDGIPFFAREENYYGENRGEKVC